VNVSQLITLNSFLRFGMTLEKTVQRKMEQRVFIVVKMSKSLMSLWGLTLDFLILVHSKNK
jgi:hypothetical protein